MLLRIAEENSHSSPTKGSPYPYSRNGFEASSITRQSKLSCNIQPGASLPKSLSNGSYGSPPHNIDRRPFLVADHQPIVTVESDGIDPAFAGNPVTTNTIDMVEHPSTLIRTNIATYHFSNFERLIFAITDDDIATFDRLNIPLEDLTSFEFENGSNILNFAIEQERVHIVLHLANLTQNRPELRDKLLKHRYRADQISAIHQVMTIGNRALIDALM